jgi:Fe-Mn family superoxide dismutase
MGMSSSGYVWFVTDQSGHTAVIPTYGSGTLLVRSRQQNTPAGGLVLGEGLKTKKALENTKMHSKADPVAASATSPASGVSHSPPPLNPDAPSRALHTSRSPLADIPLSTAPLSLYSNPSAVNYMGSFQGGARFDLTTLGETLFPLFCISAHERAWISAGYGVWGKEEWLKHFWTVLDWHKVSEAYGKWVPDTSTRI